MLLSRGEECVKIAKWEIQDCLQALCVVCGDHGIPSASTSCPMLQRQC